MWACVSNFYSCDRNGHDDIIKLLLNSGGRSSVGDTNRRSLTPLGEALISGHADSAALLINEVPFPPPPSCLVHDPLRPLSGGLIDYNHHAFLESTSWWHWRT